jgi:hypothetical protein
VHVLPGELAQPLSRQVGDKKSQTAKRPNPYITTPPQLPLFTCKIRQDYTERCWGLNSLISIELFSKTGTNRLLWWWLLVWWERFEVWLFLSPTCPFAQKQGW